MLEFNKRHEQLQLWLGRVDETLAAPLDTEAELAGQRTATERITALANDFAVKAPQIAVLTDMVQASCISLVFLFSFSKNKHNTVGGRVCA
jgi:hypothetical protein